MYKFLDILFVVFHTALIIFNLFGWIWKPTRRLNLITLLLTGASWFILGIFYGIGYCPLTDWHWQVLHKLGIYDVPNSYVQYLIGRVTGLYLKPELADTFTVVFYFLAVVLSVYYNFQGKRKRH